jgi:hypothetical protein
MARHATVIEVEAVINHLKEGDNWFGIVDEFIDTMHYAFENTEASSERPYYAFTNGASQITCYLEGMTDFKAVEINEKDTKTSTYVFNENGLREFFKYIEEGKYTNTIVFPYTDDEDDEQ